MCAMHKVKASQPVFSTAMTLPAGATIVLCNLAALLICTVLGKVIKH